MSVLHASQLLLFILGYAYCVPVPDAPVVPDFGPALSKVLNRPKRSLAAVEHLPFAASETDIPSNSASCLWDEKKRSCTVNNAALAEDFSQSDNSYANLVAHYMTCSAISDAKTCSAAGNCVWDPKKSECLFLEFFVGLEDSPCMVDAAGTVREYVSGDTCAVHAMALECYKDRICEWDFDSGDCTNEPLLLYLGFTGEELSAAADPVIAVKAAQVTQVFSATFDFDDPLFDYHEILDWKVPETECPEWADKMACAYADGIMSDIAQSYYCGAKYYRKSVFACDADPLCFFDFSSSNCRQPDDSFFEGFLQGIYNVAEYIELPVDKEILQTRLHCPLIHDKASCKGPCSWDHEDQYCSLPDIWIPRRLAEESSKKGGDEDPLCRYAADEGTSGCMAIEDSEPCLKNPNCRLLPSGMCVASIEYMTNSVLDKDKALAKAYAKRVKVCGRRSKAYC